jgi:hypothetical protein
VRSFIYGLLSSDATLNGLGINTTSLYAGDIDTPAERPFAVLRWGVTDPGIDTVNQQLLTVWIHHHPGNEDVIRSIKLRIRALITGLGGNATENGWMVAADWTGDSSDLSDDVLGTIIQQSNYSLIGSGV